MLQTSECVCTNCNCVPFVSIGSKTASEPRQVTVACKCKSASVPTDKNAKRSEVKETFIKYMATPCGVTRQLREEREMKIKYKNCCGLQPVKEIYPLAFHDPGFSLRCKGCFMRVSASINREAYELANAWNALANGREA